MAYEFGSISKRMKARKPKTKAGRGFAAGAEGFLQGVQQGMQMGMYRAMQQQQAGETENEEYAKQLDALKRSITYDPTGEIKSGITILSDQVRQGKITIQDARDLVDAEGWRDPSGFRKKEDVPKTDEQLSAEHAETLRKEGRQRGEPKEPGYVLSAKEVGDLKLTMAPPGQVWWMGDDGNPTLKGKAKGVDKALKPVRMEHMISGKAEWFNWDPVQGNFIYQSGAKAGDTLEAEELTNYKPPTANAMAELLRILQGSQPQP